MKNYKTYYSLTIFTIISKICRLFGYKKITHAFYYNHKQKNINYDWVYGIEKTSINKFKGKEYTEMKEFNYGWSNWDDAILIGIGTYSDITIN